MSRTAHARPACRPRSQWEEMFAQQVKLLGAPEPMREYRFATEIGRRWRFDFAWPLYAVGVEIEGGLWIQGRHQTAVGFQGDLDKYNLAALHGWLVLRFSPEMIRTGEGARQTRAALAAKGANIPIIQIDENPGRSKRAAAQLRDRTLSHVEQTILSTRGKR